MQSIKLGHLNKQNRVSVLESPVPFHVSTCAADCNIAREIHLQGPVTMILEQLGAGLAVEYRGE